METSFLVEINRDTTIQIDVVGAVQFADAPAPMSARISDDYKTCGL
jgi:hypothetical protein